MMTLFGFLGGSTRSPARQASDLGLQLMRTVLPASGPNALPRAAPLSSWAVSAEVLGCQRFLFRRSWFEYSRSGGTIAEVAVH